MKYKTTDDPLTKVFLPNYKTIRMLDAGTVVYIANQNCELLESIAVIIEERGATNYDNNRRAVDANRVHLFWVKGVSSLP